MTENRIITGEIILKTLVLKAVRGLQNAFFKIINVLLGDMVKYGENIQLYVCMYLENETTGF